MGSFKMPNKSVGKATVERRGLHLRKNLTPEEKQIVKEQQKVKAAKEAKAVKVATIVPKSVVEQNGRGRKPGTRVTGAGIWLRKDLSDEQKEEIMERIQP